MALEVQLIEKSSEIIYESKDESTSEYQSEIAFAINCFKEIFWRQYPSNGARIIVHRLGTLDVDTRSVVVFYVFLSALCRAINYDLDNFKIDDNCVLLVPAFL